MKEPQEMQTADLFAHFSQMKMSELEDHLLHASDHRARAFWRTLLDLRLQIEQEDVICEDLL